MSVSNSTEPKHFRVPSNILDDQRRAVLKAGPHSSSPQGNSGMSKMTGAQSSHYLPLSSELHTSFEERHIKALKKQHLFLYYQKATHAFNNY